jgi:hypothetical protein
MLRFRYGVEYIEPVPLSAPRNINHSTGLSPAAAQLEFSRIHADLGEDECKDARMEPLQRG